MVDATEKIWAVFGNHGLLAFRDDRPHSVEYTRSDLVAELEAENERLRKDRDYWKVEAEGERAKVEYRDRKAAEALSRTGALDEKALEAAIEAWRHASCGTGVPEAIRAYLASLPRPTVAAQQCDGVDQQEAVAWMRRWAFDGVDVMAMKKAERPNGWMLHAVTTNKCLADDIPLFTALSALEPVAPEGQQPVAYRIHAPEDEYYGTGSDRLQFHPLAQYDLDNGYRQTPLYTSPAEQAVTEAMVEAAARAMCAPFPPDETIYLGRYYKRWETHMESAALALKAAMEAGRHE